MVARGTDRVLLSRRPDGGLLAGLWEFPSVEAAAEASNDRIRGLAREVARQRGLAEGAVEAAAEVLPAVLHQFSHLHVTYRPVVLDVTAGDSTRSGERWMALAERGDLALPVAQQKIAHLVVAALARS